MPQTEVTMKRTRRTKRMQREQQLLAHIRRAQARKMPLAEYCRNRGLNVQSIYNLRHRLRGRSGVHRAAAGRRSRKPADPFIAVRVATPAATPLTACRLQVKGWVIECTSLPSPEWLVGVMAGDTHAVP
jgi:hypothetical protein